MSKYLMVLSRSTEQTIALGRLLAHQILPGDILAFWGDLGAGKTCMIQGICRGLGVPEDVYITSPTFVILNRYEGRLPIYHFDFYRLFSQEEIMDLGCEEFFFGQGVCMIEWADRAEGLIPQEHMKILIQVASLNERRIEMTVCGSHYQRRLSRLDPVIKKWN